MFWLKLSVVSQQGGQPRQSGPEQFGSLTKFATDVLLLGSEHSNRNLIMGPQHPTSCLASSDEE